MSKIRLQKVVIKREIDESRGTANSLARQQLLENDFVFFFFLISYYRENENQKTVIIVNFTVTSIVESERW